MVSTRRTKRGSDEHLSKVEILSNPKISNDYPEQLKNSEDDSDSDLECLVEQTFKTIKTSSIGFTDKTVGVNATEPTIVENTGFVIDKKPSVCSTSSNIHDLLHVNNEKTEVPVRDSESTDNESIYTTVYGSDDDSVSSKITKNIRLASSLQTAYSSCDTYINVDAYKNPTTQKKNISSKLLVSKDLEIMKKSVLTSDFEKRDSIPPYEESLNQIKKQNKKDRDMTKGKNWFNMQATELTEERKNDLMVLKMRRILDPKRFYKSNDIKGLPKYFEFGTVQDTPVDFYHSRIPKKERKSNMVEELLADAEFRRHNKRKYAEIQEATRKSKGAFKHMKRLKKRR